MTMNLSNPEFPRYDASVFKTDAGVSYLTEPGVALLAKPQVCINLEGFLDGFDDLFDTDGYINESDEGIGSGAVLSKLAGQACYLSFGEKRTKNTEAAKYFDNIKSSGHGSVLEHPNYTLFFYGLDRSATHEAVRHRAGFGFSQVSQRYVDGKALRFVERPEYQSNSDLHSSFVNWINRSSAEYDSRAELLKGTISIEGLSRTDARKRVNQAARACLPNETEAPIVITANARGWRHFGEVRANEHADVLIREIAYRAMTILQYIEPVIFSDYEFNQEKRCVSTPWRKV